MSGFLPAIGFGFFSPGRMIVIFLELKGDELAALAALIPVGRIAEGVVTTGGDESDEMDELRGMVNRGASGDVTDEYCCEPNSEKAFGI